MRSKRAGPPGAAWAGPASADRDAIRIARAPAAKRGGWWRRCPVVPRQACVPPQDRLASARRALRRAVTRRVVAAHRGRSAARTSRGGASRKQLIAQTFRHRCSRESGRPESLRPALVVLGSRFRGTTWHPSAIAPLLLLPRRAVHSPLRSPATRARQIGRAPV